MDRRRSGNALYGKLVSAGLKPALPLPAPVYRDLVAPLFTMRLPILGFGILYVFVGILVLLRWPDPAVFALTVGAIGVTAVRMLVLHRYDKAGGARQPIQDLTAWEWRYTALTFLFSALLAGLNIRVLAVHEPLLHMGTVSLIFTFGAGVVSRTACRPRLCVGGLLIAVVPTALAMLWHAADGHDEPLHAEFFGFFAMLLLAVLVMSLESVRYLYGAALEQITTRHDLAKLARYDALTGLPNRLMLREAFQFRLAKAQQAGTQLAVHCLDLDGFKSINDGYGHPVGDRMLTEVAGRLLATIRSDDVAFRLGGDEFVLIQTKVSHRDEVELLARRVIKQLSEPYVFDGTQMRISVSIGIALVADVGCDLDELVACADAALYRSKARGKAQLQFSEPGEPGEPGRSAA